VATALDIEGENLMRPVRWVEWITLRFVRRTKRGTNRAWPDPRADGDVAVNFAKVPKKRPKLCARTIRERDGNRCQYTGKLLKPDERQPRPRPAPLRAAVRTRGKT